MYVCVCVRESGQRCAAIWTCASLHHASIHLLTLITACECERDKRVSFSQVLIVFHDSQAFLNRSQVFVVMPIKVKGGPEAEARVLAVVS